MELLTPHVLWFDELVRFLPHHDFTDVSDYGGMHADV